MPPQELEQTLRVSRAAGRLKPSSVREILKMTESPEVISFAGGLPAPELFPVDAIARACQTVMATDGPAALQYGVTEGYRPLREWVADHLSRTVGLARSAEDVLITGGSQQALDLVARINGRICLIDYKTKGTTRDGTVKALDDKVVMQLVAGMKAEESLVDPVAGEWEAWKYGESPMLLAVAIGETEVRPHRANPDVLKHHWWKFCALRRVWEMSADTVSAGQALLPLAPPSFAPASARVAAAVGAPVG